MYIDGGDLDEVPSDWTAWLRERHRRKVAAARAAMSRMADERSAQTDERQALPLAARNP